MATTIPKGSRDFLLRRATLLITFSLGLTATGNYKRVLALLKRRAASRAHNFVSQVFEVASDTFRLIALNFDLSPANGTPASKMAADAARQLLEFQN